MMMGYRRFASAILAAAIVVVRHLWATMAIVQHSGCCSTTSSITTTQAFSTTTSSPRSPRRRAAVVEQVVPPLLQQKVSFSTLVSSLPSVPMDDDNEQKEPTSRSLLTTTVSSNEPTPHSDDTAAVSTSSLNDDNAANGQQRSSLELQQVDDILKTPGGQRLDRLYSFVDYYYLNNNNNNAALTNKYDDGNNDNNPLVMVRHAPGSLGGAAALIAGTTVGAGVLALPSATMDAGFVPSTTALVLAWIVMLTSGLLLAELSLQQTLRTGQPGQGLLQQLLMLLQQQQSSDQQQQQQQLDADDSDPNSVISILPVPLQPLLRGRLLSLAFVALPWLGILSYFFLHYAVMVAYMAQGGAILEQTMFQHYDFTLTATVPGPVVFAAGTAGFLASSSNSRVERINNALVAVVAMSLTGIVLLGASHHTAADWSSLIDPSRQHWQLLPTCMPIVLLSLVYQNVVPTVVMQLEGNRNKIVQAIILGTAVPLVMFVMWNAVVLGNMASSDATTAGMDPVALLQLGSTANEVGGNLSSLLLSPLVTIFSMSALVTSVIGFTYGLLDAWTDVLGVSTINNPQAMEQWKLPLFALVFVPPVALSLANPDIFYTALDYGGAFGVSTLFLLLPPLLVWRQRGETLQNKANGKPTSGADGEMDAMAMTPLVPGGPVSLAALVSVGLGLLLQQGADKFGAVFSDVVVP